MNSTLGSSHNEIGFVSYLRFSNKFVYDEKSRVSSVRFLVGKLDLKRKNGTAIMNNDGTFSMM